VALTVKDFPELKNYIGQTLIVTDGTTLLGADDKAGIAEIIPLLSTGGFVSVLLPMKRLDAE